MKKLLSILASLAVTGSSASAVVACGQNLPGYNNNIKNSGTDTGSDSSNTGSNDSGDQLIPGGTTNGTGNNSNNNSGNSSAADRQKAYNLEKTNVLEDMSTAAKSQIPMDLWGFNGKSQYPVLDYLNHMKDSKGQPILSDKLKGTLNTVLGLIGGASVPSPTGLGATISGLLPILPALQSTITNAIGGADGAQKIIDKVSGILTPDVKKIVDEIIDNGSTLDKYTDLTFNQSLDSVAMGIAYIFGILTGDFKDSAQFKDMANPEKTVDNTTIANKAVLYIAQKVVALSTKSVKIDISNLAKHQK